MFVHTCIISVPETALLWRQESCAEGERKGGGGETRLGACSDSTLPPSTHTQEQYSTHPYNTHSLTSTHRADGDVKIMKL